MITTNRYINREISWLQFNDRVLQESADKNVPLIERLRFLGIFSNNLDEFFKVRYATVKRIVEAGKKGKAALGGTAAKELLEEITKVVIGQQAKSGKIFDNIIKELSKEGIHLLQENEVSTEQLTYLRDYFVTKVNSKLTVIILNNLTQFPTLKDTAAYLAVRIVLKNKGVFFGGNQHEVQYALIEIPREANRFIVLPKTEKKDYIIMLDDCIRLCMDKIFTMFDYDEISAHMIKITRDAELDMDNDFSKSFVEKISSSVAGRKVGDPVRFVYDKTIRHDTLKFLMNKMDIGQTDSVIPGGRYHNRRDYMSFPSLGRIDLLYPSITPLPIKDFSLGGGIFKQIAKRDFLQYVPYHTFSYLTMFLKEAALDPQVKTIKITVYRLAKISDVASALINAAKNGKEVTVQLELQARFDESANIKYANAFKEGGVKLIFGIQGLKVHSKICVVEREEDNQIKRYGFFSTGNFNESTAKVYTDYTLFTARQSILKELNQVFQFLETPYLVGTYRHLIISPHYTMSTFKKLIDKEIENAKQGKEAYIHIKMNSFTSYKMVDKLYDASRAGVKIQLIVRGICCLIPGIEGMSENIEVISIVDKFLEHPRLFIFGNDGNPKVYISSADWMTRNLEYRVEVGCPIYDPEVKKELIETFEISWRDNVKARIISEKANNAYRPKDGKTLYRSQFDTYDYYLHKIEGTY